jgi:hypothetical protein
MQRLPPRADGYTLDLDSTVFERYGQPEGSLKGHNPRQHGRPSHNPLLAVLSEAHFLLHGWLRSGNCGTSRGVEEFLKEAAAATAGPAVAWRSFSKKLSRCGDNAKRSACYGRFNRPCRASMVPVLT